MKSFLTVATLFISLQATAEFLGVIPRELLRGKSKRGTQTWKPQPSNATMEKPLPVTGKAEQKVKLSEEFSPEVERGKFSLRRIKEKIEVQLKTPAEPLKPRKLQKESLRISTAQTHMKPAKRKINAIAGKERDSRTQEAEFAEFEEALLRSSKEISLDQSPFMESKSSQPTPIPKTKRYIPLQVHDQKKLVYDEHRNRQMPDLAGNPDNPNAFRQITGVKTTTGKPVKRSRTMIARLRECQQLGKYFSETRSHQSFALNLYETRCFHIVEQLAIPQRLDLLYPIQATFLELKGNHLDANKYLTRSYQENPEDFLANYKLMRNLKNIGQPGVANHLFSHYTQSSAAEKIQPQQRKLLLRLKSELSLRP
ncbi:hypothetical protein HOF92_08590 [bacterium]|jgi:hypothetical protein|nr:hypothetical protein [bacterium]